MYISKRNKHENIIVKKYYEDACMYEFPETN